MSDTIKCACLPLSHGEYLIVPNNAVAEIVSNRGDLLVMGARQGLIGKIQWRGYSVPLVAYEAAIDHAIPSYNQESRIAILFSETGDSAMPYLAFSIQGAPIIKELEETDLISREGEEHELVAAHVQIGDDIIGFVPNLTPLETYVKGRVN
ncbi:MAG: chemotaxis protein CheW [Pseudomonadota bacterium]